MRNAISDWHRQNMELHVGFFLGNILAVFKFRIYFNFIKLFMY